MNYSYIDINNAYSYVTNKLKVAIDIDLSDRDLYSILYVVPYEDLPIYINSKNDMIAALAEWRILYGK